MTYDDNNDGDNDSGERAGDEHALAYAAVSLAGNQTSGDPPQLHELLAWREGGLPEARAAEVLSHIANDPEVFQHLLDLAEAEAYVSEETLQESLTSDATHEATHESAHEPARSETVRREHNRSGAVSLLDRIRSFFEVSPALYGGAFAAIALSVLIVPLLRQGDALSLQQQLDRSMDTYIESGLSLSGEPPVTRNTRSLGGLFEDLSKNDVERLYFLKGIRLTADRLSVPAESVWGQWIDALESTEIDCSTAVDVEHCASVGDDLTSLAQWSLMNVAACRLADTLAGAGLSEQYWQDQHELYAKLRLQPGIAESQRFAPLLHELTEVSSDRLCQAADAIISATQ